MKDLFRQHCKILRLGNRIVENYQEIKAENQEQFLEQLLRMEVEARKINRINRLLKQAKFDVIKTFENYHFGQIEIPQSIDVATLKSVSFVDKKQNLILYGPTGTGKTHLATAIGVEACNQCKKVGFF